MIARVTSQTQMRSAQTNLQANLARMAQLQEQATSLKAIARPSDDPARAADSLTVRAEQRAVTQYARNADNGDGWLTTASMALAEATNLLNQVRDLTVQGANDGALSPAAKEAIAARLDGLTQNLLAQANADYLGRSVFAGNSDAGLAFRDDPDFTFTGTATASVDRRIGADTTVRVDADGAAIFGTATNSIFALIGTIADDLRTGTNVGTHLTAIDLAMKTVLTAQTDVGVRQAQIQKAGEALVQHKGNLEAQRAGIEDVDLGQAILDLKLQEVTYQAALSVTARVLQPTLMDFLR
ncbi:flagellar hook-associated protein 3 [Cryobacterium sp. Hz7]|uniref:Flagellar hook-associated protein 3 n=1 Tax=Cryobacterium sandaracinum TaxID=1259247 RepID=A0ABY2J8A8_9MICO|nr:MULTISPECIES: flagellar hook-associated protein FlgL [Cryobacterium]TFB59471.1 flagellar hook-associated protein 3 [Cryobacterium sp. Hz7]TFD01184.1 flagellar hook-associated protein 3 [Cryobacterium sandaracinum]